jgi:hypothetical protein
MSGYVNKQNCRDWAHNNTHELQEGSLHSSQVTAWCTISSHGDIGPCFFDKARGRTVTVTAAGYKVMQGTFLRNDICCDFNKISCRNHIR